MAFPTTRRWPKTAGSRWVAREKAAVLARFGKLSRELTKLALQGSKASFRWNSGPKSTQPHSRAISQFDPLGRGCCNPRLLCGRKSPGALPPTAPIALIPVNNRAGVAIDSWAVIAGVAIDPRAVIAGVTVAVNSRPINASATVAGQLLDR